MAQHYLLSSKSKNLNLKQIFRLTEDEAFQLLKAHRWGIPIISAMFAVRIVVFAIRLISYHHNATNMFFFASWRDK